MKSALRIVAFHHGIQSKSIVALLELAIEGLDALDMGVAAASAHHSLVTFVEDLDARASRTFANIDLLQ